VQLAAGGFNSGWAHSLWVLVLPTTTLLRQGVKMVGAVKLVRTVTAPVVGASRHRYRTGRLVLRQEASHLLQRRPLATGTRCKQVIYQHTATRGVG